MECDLSDTESRPLRIPRIILILLSLIGIGFSIRCNLELSRLRQTHADLREQVGFLDVADPSQVAISHVPTSDDAVPPGVDQAHLWRYRMYFPANYGASYRMQHGLVKAVSPQGRGGSSSTWSGPKAKSEEALMTIALIKSDGKWILCRSVGGSSSTSSMPKDFDFESLDELVVETPLLPSDKTRTYATDDAICLIRLREKQLAKKRNNKPEKDLYRGFNVYVYGAQHKDAFDAWSQGEATSMKEATP